jgi:diaminopimelate decarboxylase
VTTDFQNGEQQLLSEIFPLGTKRDDRGVLLLGNAPVDQLIAQHGSPLYVFDEATIRAQCQSYTHPLSNLYPNSLALYAAKAHIDPTIAGIAAAEGFGMDAVSSGEIRVGLAGGMPADRIVMHGNNKLPSEIEYALDTGVSRIVADSLDEIDLIADIAAHREITANLLLRVTPGVEAHTHDYIRTGAIDSKFGLPLASGQAEIAVGKCMQAPWIRPIGLHSHIGSQIFELAPYADSIGILLDFAEDMHHKHGFVLSDFSPGGGFGIRYEESDDPPAADAFVQTIAEAVHSRNLNPGPRLLIEPGRSIIARAGVALYSVGTIKTIPGVRTYVSVDGGMADNIRPALYEATYCALLANREATDTPARVTVAGRYCESGDVLIREIELPPLTRGDILAVPAAGAYHLSMASNYNMVGRPATVLVCDGVVTLTRKRETDKDLLRIFGASVR